MSELSRPRISICNIRLVFLWVHISLVCVICSHGTFILRNQEENEVVYVGETITLECRAPGDVSNPQFRLLDSQNIVAVDHSFTSIAEGHFGYPSQGGENFQIDIRSESQMKYSCEISGDGNFLITEEINLNVSPRISPVCFVNTRTSLIPGESVELACYLEIMGVLDVEIEWRQILKNGSVKEQLTSDFSSLINSFKRKYSTQIRASISDDGSEFECVIMQDSGEEMTCTTGEISVQNNQELELTFSGQDILLPLDKEDVRFIKCSSSDSNYVVSWQESTGYENSEVIVTVFGMDTIFIEIPIDTVLMSGDILNFVCMASREGNTVFRVLTLNVLFASVPNPSTTTTMATSTLPQVMLIFSPHTVTPLGRGDVRIIECTSSVPGYDITWVENVDDGKADVTITGNTLIVSIPTDTTLVSGDVLNFVCLATLNGVTVPVSRTLAIDVLFASTTTTDPIYPSTLKISTAGTTSPMDSDMTTSYPQDEHDTDGAGNSSSEINTTQTSVGVDFTIYIITAGAVAVFLVAIIFIILIAICITKKGDHLTREQRNFKNAAYDSNNAGETSNHYTSVHKKSVNDPGPDVVPQNDVSRKKHVIEIDEDEIYDDSKDWRGSHEL